MNPCLKLSAACALLFGHVSLASSQTATSIPAYPFPGDPIGIPLKEGGICNSGPFVDRERAPRIRLLERRPGVTPTDDFYTYELTYHAVAQGDICITPPPARMDAVVDIGPLPLGTHHVTVRGLLGDAPYAEYTSQFFTVTDQRRPGDDISGAWHAPRQSGRGYSVMRRDDLLIVYWTTHDDDGEPVWLVFSSDAHDDGTYSGPLYFTHGAPFGVDAAELETSVWGRATFTYTGCGKATWSWVAEDPWIQAGELDLVQLMTPDGVAACDFTTRRIPLAAEWIQ